MGGTKEVSSVGTNSVSTASAKKPQKAESVITIPVGKNATGTQNIQDNITKDFISGVLTRDEGKIWGVQVNQPSLVYDSDKYRKLTGKELTLGEIKARYGLPDGVIKKLNPELGLGTITFEGGLTLDGYTPTYAGSSKIKLPLDLIKDLDIKS